MRIDNIFQFIVPLTFLAIWALTSLFNREAQPLPPRTNRPPGPPNSPGPKPVGAPGAPRPEPAMRWSTPATVPERPGIKRPPGRPDDEILIIESEPRRATSAPGSRPSGGSSTRRAQRARPVSTPRRPEPTPKRTISGTAGQGIPLHINQPLGLNPLAPPQSPLSTQEVHDIARPLVEPSRPAGRPALSTADLRPLLTTPARLRETIILNEVLQPPLALRRPRPSHRG